MRTSLFVLPFLALLFVALGVVTGLALKELPWVSYLFYSLSGSSVLLWAILDKEGFSTLFKRKGAKYGATSGITVILGIIIIVGLGFLSTRARFNKSYDVTREGINTLSDQSIKAINSINEAGGDISIQGFFQDELKKQKFSDLLSLYTSNGLKVEVDYIDPQADPTKALAANVTTADTVILTLNEQESRLTSYTEEKMTNGFLSLLKTGTKKVVFITGHGEKDLSSQEAEGFALAQQELESERFQVETLNLLEVASIPTDNDLLVIAGPKYDLRENEIALLESYMKQGHPVLVMVDAMTDLPNLKGLLVNYGLEFKDDILLLRPDDPRAQILGQNNAIVTDFDQFSPATQDFAKQGSIALVVSNARSIGEVTDNKNNMKPSLVAKTADIIIGVNRVKRPKDLENLTQDRVLTGPFAVVGISVGQVGGSELASKEAENKKDVPSESTAVAKELRLAVLGSSDIVSNIGAQRAENVDMFLNVINYLTQDESFISIRPKDITKSTLDLSTASSQLMLLFFAYLYPTLFLGGGVFYWMRRRRA